MPCRTRSPGPTAPPSSGSLLIVLGGIVLAIAIAVWVRGGFGIEALVDAISYLAFAAPIATFLVMFRSPKVSSHERTRLRAYIPLFVAAMLFWMIFEQAANTLSSFAQDRTDLHILGIAIPPEFFQSVNPAAIIILAPVFAWIWMKLGDRPPTAVKFALGLMFAALSFVFLAIGVGRVRGQQGAVLGARHGLRRSRPSASSASLPSAWRRPPCWHRVRSAGRPWRCGSWRLRRGTRSPPSSSRAPRA